VSESNQEGNNGKSPTNALLEICKEFMRKGFEIPLLVSIVFLISLWIVAGNLDSRDLKEIVILHSTQGLLPILGWVLFIALLVVTEFRIARLKRSLQARLHEVEERNEKLLDSKITTPDPDNERRITP
jgi:hypothetical protein